EGVTANRIYIARIAGLPVFDPNRDLVGRVRDAVARVRPMVPPAGPGDANPPYVVGLVAELPLARRIFLPIGRIDAIDAEAVVLGTGKLSVRRFEQRPGELLVLQDLLDREVTIVESGQKANVVDVAMEQDHTGQWHLRRVAVRESAGRLGRRGPLRELEWDEVRGLSGVAQGQGTASPPDLIEGIRAPGLANLLQDLPATRRNEVAAALEDDRLADVLGELPESDQVEILAALDRDRAADVLEEMAPDDAADLLAELPKRDRDELLGLME